MKKRFQDLKLPIKMLTVYALFAGIFCTFALIALQIGWNIYDEKLYEKSMQELEFFSVRVNESIEDTESLSRSIALDQRIQEHLAGMQKMKYMSSDYALGLHQLRNMLLSEMNESPWVENIIYLDGKMGSVKAGTDTGTFPEAYLGNLLVRIEDAHGQSVSQNPTEEYPYLVSGRKILEVKNASLDDFGTLILTSDIKKIIERENRELEAEHATLYVYSEDGMIYQGGELGKENLPKLSEDKGYRIVRDGQEKYFMCYMKSRVNGWMYVNYFPYSEIYGYTTVVRSILIISFLLLFFCIILAMQKIARVITRPLDKLVDSMQIVEQGDFKTAVSILEDEVNQDEVGILTQEFRVMLEKIDVLIYENYEKQILLKDTNYKMLQAQINPHFLYNTLNAVIWMVKGQKNEEAIRMITELGKILRASFSKEQYVTVDEELDIVQGYITIQQYRYKNRAEFQISRSGSMGEYIIPKMVLQPLVENAIQYGVESSADFCRIVIKAAEQENEIVLCVCDDGPGMNREELEAVKNGTMKPKGNGIGIQNIRERLAMTYAESTFSIESSQGEGTRICITIPKKQKGEQHV